MSQFKPHGQRAREHAHVSVLQSRSSNRTGKIRAFHPKNVWDRLSTSAKLGIVLALVFLGMVATPAVLALSLHKGGIESAAGWTHTSDAKDDVTVYRMGSNQTVHMTLADYLTNVLAAQFSPNDSLPAMEAAAVVARTYVVGAMAGVTTSRTTASVAQQHGAIVTDNGMLDLPFLTVAEQSQKYGPAAQAVISRIQGAIQATDGQILTYNNRPIMAFTTAVSAGSTRTANFSESLPYIKSVACPDDSSAPGFTHTYTFTPAMLMRDLAWKSPNTSTFHVAAADSSGYVKTVSCGSYAATGADFANRLHLASVNFTLETTTGGNLVVTTKGIGSGYGMSLYEAKRLGARGWSANQILSRFYPSTKPVSDERWIHPNS